MRRSRSKPPAGKENSGRCTICCSRTRHLKLPQLRHYAQRLELDLARYDIEMKEDYYLQRVREHMESGRASGVRGTPGFFVKGAIEDVSFGMQRLFDRVQAVLHRPTA